MRMSEPLVRNVPRPVAQGLGGRRVLVLGLGETGLSVARWVARQGGTPVVADNRANPGRAHLLGELVPEASLRLGPFSPDLLSGIDLLAISPGLALTEAIVQMALQQDIPVVGEIELFAWHVRNHDSSRILAITGTNGKTTTTALTGEILRTAGLNCEVAGNIGPSALAALMARMDHGNPPAIWVLELSSYQLETTWSLDADAAVMLNLSEDHLDRYAALEDYGAAKARIFLGHGAQVVNRDDPYSASLSIPDREYVSFGLGVPPRDADFGLRQIRDQRWLSQGDNAFLNSENLRILGTHNTSNALAACALARLAGASYSNLADGLNTFPGLPHRMQRVSTRNGVVWFNDSKGTNIGATKAALEGSAAIINAVSPSGKALLILGGEGKGQDFSELSNAVRRHASRVLLIGRDAPLIESALAATGGVPIVRCQSLEEAVSRAERHARPGDWVLLSPACASFDMFRDYAHRGETFVAAVHDLEGKGS